MPLAVWNNIVRWAGAFLSPATTTPTGLETAPVVRALHSKICRNLGGVIPPVSSTTYFGPLGLAMLNSSAAGWFDTQQTCTTYVQVNGYASAGSAAGSDGYYLIETNDPSNNSETVYIVNYMAQANSAQTINFGGAITKRYWQIKVINGTIALTQLQFNTTEWQGCPSVYIDPTTSGQCLAAGAVPDASSPTNGPSNPALITGAGVIRGNVPQASVSMVATSAASTGPFYYQRTPAIFRSASCSAGLNTIWTPASTKKFRLMKYKIEAEADMHVTAATTVTLSLLDGGLGAGFQHLVYIPTTGGTALNGYWESDWIDLGNGYVSAAANNTMQLGISGPLSSTTQAPAFSQTSAQWEAGALLFKTSGATGAVGGQCVQAQAATPVSATSVALAYTKGNIAGNTLVVICAEKNGTTTLTIADTSANSWTAATAAVNGTDGVTTRAFYCVNCKSSTAGANTVTVTGTAAASQMKMIILEYSNVSAFDTGAASNATGNNAAPTTGSSTAAATSDLVVAYASNGGSSNTISAGTGYTARLSSSDANSTLAVEDSLYQVPAGLAGAFNVIAIGTEE
jgi:hypothetical protein